MDQNRKFAEMAGIHWHESKDKFCVCAECGYIANTSRMDNPDFSDPREVLKVVDRDDLRRFLRSIAICPDFFIKIDYITTPGKLRDAWMEWISQRESKPKEVGFYEPAEVNAIRFWGN
jgi:hypothetical protein